MVQWLLVAQIAFWQPVQTPVLHQGSWQSCDHEERVLEHRVNGQLLWEMHLGPDDEFALYRTSVDGEHDHASSENLLGSAFHYEAMQSRSGRTWTVLALRLWINVVRAGGSRDECQAYWVRIEQTK